MNINETLLHPEGRVLSTLEQDGSRRWLHPKLSKGRFWFWRRNVAYVLIGVFMGVPYLRIGGKPVMLLDVVHRRFTLMGVTFLPTDTVLLALLAVSTILLVFFVTALFGRVWCGWACPQTVYMEFLFRPIERLFTGRSGTGGAPRGQVASWRIVAMYATYLVASFYLAHTFLSYFVGVDQLRHWVTGSPADHPAAFVLILATATPRVAKCAPIARDDLPARCRLRARTSANAASLTAPLSTSRARRSLPNDVARSRPRLHV